MASRFEQWKRRVGTICIFGMILPSTVFSANTIGKTVRNKTKSPVQNSLNQKAMELLRQSERTYTSAKTMQAHFKQNTQIASLNQTKLSEGTIFVSFPLKVRWETEKPDSNVLVLNGEKAWFYTPPFEKGGRGQGIERRVLKGQAQLLNSILAGKFSSEMFQKVDALSDRKFRFIPKPGVSGDVNDIEVEIDPESKRVTQVYLSHTSGNVTQIQLSNIVSGKVLAENLFRRPEIAGTDWIKE